MIVNGLGLVLYTYFSKIYKRSTWYVRKKNKKKNKKVCEMYVIIELVHVITFDRLS